MSRLLFAAARGAQIQGLNDYGHSWRNEVVIYIGSPVGSYRIHPDDEHLQYGPISTAILNYDLCELECESFPTLAIHAAMACEIDGSWLREWRKQNVGERSLSLLILAEALADEGL